MRKLLTALYLVCILILVFDLLEFIYLDKKITEAIHTQMEINNALTKVQSEQAKAIRVLESDCLVLTNIIINGDYLDE